MSKMVNIYKLYQLDDGDKEHSTWEYYLHRKDTDFAKHCCRMGEMLVEKIQVSQAGKRYAKAVKNSQERRTKPCCSPEVRYNCAMRARGYICSNPINFPTAEEMTKLAREGDVYAQELEIVINEVGIAGVKRWKDAFLAKHEADVERHKESDLRMAKRAKKEKISMAKWEKKEKLRKAKYAQKEKEYELKYAKVLKNKDPQQANLVAAVLKLRTLMA
jgi:hypothetical protein